MEGGKEEGGGEGGSRVSAPLPPFP